MDLYRSLNVNHNSQTLAVTNSAGVSAFNQGTAALCRI